MKKILAIIGVAILAVVIVNFQSESRAQNEKRSKAERHDSEHAHGEGAEESHAHDHDSKEEKSASHDDHEEHDGESPNEAQGHAHGEAHGDEEHGEHSEGGSASVGEGKAVTEIRDGGTKFKLSEASSNRIGLQFETLSGSAGGFDLPASALVESLEAVSVFRRTKDGFIESVPVSIGRRVGNRVVVRGAQLKPGDQVATAAVPILRAAQLEVSGQGGEGHAH